MAPEDEGNNCLPFITNNFPSKFLSGIVDSISVAKSPSSDLELRLSGDEQ
jgi:hypothetical protein